MRHLLCATAALVLLLPTTAAAQFEFMTGLFKDVHSITFYGQATELTGGSQIRGTHRCIMGSAICGAGAEVLIDLTAPEDLHVELGLGASFQRGFRARNTDLDLRGAVRSLPSFGAYVTGTDVLGGVVEPYIGANFGFSELWNVQAYDSAGFEHSIKGSTFDWGGTLGLYFNFPVFDGLFVEASRRSRRFSSLDYTFPGATAQKDSVRAGWPRELDFSGWQFSIGWQFDLKRQPPPDALYQGVWYLSRTDALPLPATVSQGAAAVPKTTIRRELVSGLLSTMEDVNKSYLLDLFYRDVTYDEGGRQIGVAPPCMSTESGTYRVEGATLVLDPGTTQDALLGFKALRFDEELRLQSRETGLGLVFKKAKGGSAAIPPSFTTQAGIQRCPAAVGG